MEQLPGVVACQSDDVIRQNWHGMLHDIFHSYFAWRRGIVVNMLVSINKVDYLDPDKEEILPMSGSLNGVDGDDEVTLCRARLLLRQVYHLDT